jgi:uncharacterized damage-inducible protein DinB
VAVRLSTLLQQEPTGANSMIQYLPKLFAYDDWANREVLATLKSNSTERSRKLLAHIVSAERLWLERLEQKAQSLPVWPDLSLERCEQEISDLAARWKGRVRERADLSHEVAYKNSKGESWSSREDDILLHVITHSAYHRGQIASDLRAAGFTPAYTDFIHGVRQGLVK